MKILRLKNTVKINGKHFSPEVRCMLDVACHNAPEMQKDEVWVTSANDSTHKKGSLHYADKAFDIRTKNVVGGPEAVKIWAKNIQIELGPDYDVVNEEDHLHLELDPKGAKNDDPK